MRSCFQVLSVALLAACSEYNMTSGPGPDVATDPSTTLTDTDATTPAPSTTAFGWETLERPEPEPVPGTTTPTGEPTTPEEEVDTPRDEGVQVDVAVQAGSFLVDVLWVVDNSSSMGDDQDSLATNFPAFMDYFENIDGIDYHIGVVSTDVEDPSHEGKLREADGLRWLDASTPDKVGKFDEMAQMGTDGSGDESGRAAIHHATVTHRDGWNAGFFRDDAALAVIVISDEKDHSDTFGVELDPFIDAFLTFKPDAAMVSISTIVGPVPSGCATADPGYGYDELQAQTGGVFHSICDADWAKVLEDVAAHALSTRREFFLAAIPDPESLEAQVIEADGAELWFDVNVDFTYDAVRNSITFTSYLPGPLAEVNVHYVPDFGSGW